MANLDKNKETLKQEVKKLERREGALNSAKAISKNKLKKTKDDLLQKLFKMMSDAGVDLNSLESINEFLSKLENQDPDLREIFEEGFNNLTNPELESAEQGMQQGAPQVMPQGATQPDTGVGSNPFSRMSGLPIS